MIFCFRSTPHLFVGLSQRADAGFLHSHSMNSYSLQFSICHIQQSHAKMTHTASCLRVVLVEHLPVLQEHWETCFWKGGCCLRLLHYAEMFWILSHNFLSVFQSAIQQFWTQRKQEQIRVVAHSAWLFALTEGIYSKCLIFWKEWKKLNAPSQSQAVNIGQFFILSHAVITREAGNYFDLSLSKCSSIVQHFGKHVHKNWANHLLFARVFSICSAYWGLPAFWNKSLASFLLSAPICDFKSFEKKLQHQRCVP